MEFIPKEISEFIDLPGNHSLLVKGLPGTGKTTFSLMLIRETSDRFRWTYLSSRISKEDIFSHYPWLRDEERFEVEEFRLTTPSTALKKILDLISSSTCVVIDSWDAFANLIPKEEREKAENAIVSSASALKSFVLFVCEREEHYPLDYLVDGIVNLRKMDMEGRTIRELKIEKLRGVEVKRDSYVFTLHNAEFRCAKPWTWGFIPRERRRTVEPKFAAGRILPSMVEGLDEILGGGWGEGSINLIEVFEGVGNRYIALTIPSQLAHLQGGNSLIVMPTMAFRGKDIVENFVKGFVVPDPLENLRFILPQGTSYRKSRYVLTIRLEDPLEAAESFVNYCSSLISRSRNGTLVVVLGLDTLENEMGPKGASEFLYKVASWIKVNPVFCFLILKEKHMIPRRIVHMADTHFKVRPRDGSVIIYGVVPETRAMILEASFSQGCPKVSLVPIE